MNNTSSTAVMEQNSVILVVNEYEKVSHRGHFLWTPTHEKKKSQKKCHSRFTSWLSGISILLRMKIFVARVRLQNWFCEVEYNGEVNPLLAYFKGHAP